jgi:hypothetical protein
MVTEPDESVPNTLSFLVRLTSFEYVPILAIYCCFLDFSQVLPTKYAPYTVISKD